MNRASLMKNIETVLANKLPDTSICFVPEYKCDVENMHKTRQGLY